MSKYENKISDDKLSSIEQPCEPDRDDPLGPPDQLDSAAIPPGVDRRTFLMRSAVVGATAVITGAQISCRRENIQGHGTCAERTRWPSVWLT